MEIEPNKQAASWLERENWRTTQRENRRQYEQQSTAGKWGSILSAIIAHQNKNHGISPPNHIISRDTGLSPGQVQYHIAEMEDRGLITDMKGWPRRIVVKDIVKVAGLSIAETKPFTKPEEAKVVNMSDTKTRTDFSKTPFVERAKQVAEAVTDYHDRYGKAPGTKDIQTALGYKSSAGASRLVNRMADIGWLFHKRRNHHDLVLTALGRALLFGEVREDVDTNTPVHGDRLPSQRGYDSRVNPVHVREQPRATVVPELQPVHMEVRRATPEPQSPPVVAEASVAVSHNLSGVDTVDLLLELQARGLKVSR